MSKDWEEAADEIRKIITSTRLLGDSDTDTAKAVLQALSHKYAIVPREPTEEILDASECECGLMNSYAMPHQMNDSFKSIDYKNMIKKAEIKEK